jgi:rSAM/selenodomain-associated transferase 1
MGNHLGIFARAPVPGRVKTRLVPALSPDDACELYRAFLGDLFERLGPVKSHKTVFLDGEPAETVRATMPKSWGLVPQADGDLGARMASAFASLLDRPGRRAVLIGSDSPDIPLVHIRHAFQKLRHRDVVIGPAMDGGYYLIGMHAPAPGIFDGVRWGESSVLMQTVERIEKAGLTLSLLPPWYDVDDEASLSLLRALCAARRHGGGVRLPRTEQRLAIIR